MAFGLSRPATGLIVAEPFTQPDARIRFVIDFARAYAGAVTLLIPSKPADPLAVNERAAWLRRQFPDIELVEGIAPAARADAGMVECVIDALGDRQFDLLFTAGAIDEASAARIRARSIPCFPDAALQYGSSLRGRDADTATPQQPLLRVCLFGPESTGKTTLASQLAQHFHSAYAADYVRAYLDALGSTGTADDVPWIARGQLATDSAAAAQAGRVLVTDTSLASTALWSDVLYGTTPQWIHEQAQRQRYDLWLLTDIDISFEPDPLRCFPGAAQRQWFMEECRRTLARLGVEAVLLRGDVPQRLGHALAAIGRLLMPRAAAG